MSKHRKFLQQLLDGQADNNIAFDDLCSLLKRSGFQVRVKGDHHIFTRDDIAEIINLQPLGAKAKPYQVKQVRTILRSHQLLKEDE